MWLLKYFLKIDTRQVHYFLIFCLYESLKICISFWSLIVLKLGMGNVVLKCNETQKGVLFFFQNLVGLDIIFKNFLEIMKVPFWKMWQCKKKCIELELEFIARTIVIGLFFGPF